MNEKIKWIIQSFQTMMLLGVAIASVVGAVLVVIPQIQEAWELRNEISEDKETRDELGERLASLSELDEQDLDERVLLVMEVLPEDMDIALIISNLRQLSAEFDVEVGDVSIAVVNPGGDGDDKKEETKKKSSNTELITQKFNLAVKAIPIELDKFIEELEKIKPMMKVSGVKATTGGQDRLDASFVIDAYALPVAEKKSEALLTAGRLEISGADEKLLESFKEWREYEFIPATITGDEGRMNPFEFE